MSKGPFHIKKEVFSNWYFTNRTQEQVATFISPHFLNLIYKDVHFSLRDLLDDVGEVPSHLVDGDNTTKPNILISAKNIKLID